jgi:hypothetical protein
MKLNFVTVAIALVRIASAASAQQSSEASRHALSPNALPATVDPSIFDPTRPLPRSVESKAKATAPARTTLQTAKPAVQTIAASGSR